MNAQKIKIAKEWEYITFTKMQGVEERTVEELSAVLAFEKSIRGIF